MYLHNSTKVVDGSEQGQNDSNIGQDSKCTNVLQADSRDYGKPSSTSGLRKRTALPVTMEKKTNQMTLYSVRIYF